MYCPDGPVELCPVGEVEFVQGLAAAAVTGLYGPCPAASARTASAELQKWSSGTSLAKLRYEFPFQTNSDRDRMIADLAEGGFTGRITLSRRANQHNL
jgi:hypothetical protein